MVVDLERGIDVIVSWPRNADYPLWREFIHTNRQRFNKVIVVFTETNQGENLREGVKGVMKSDDIIFIESPQIMPGQDWRSVAVNQALAVSKSEWVWFTEQDFFVKDGFWDEVTKFIRTIGVATIGVKEGDRIHPCSLFVPRGIIEQTSKDFGIRPDRSDHFSVFTDEVDEWGKDKGLTNKYISANYWVHMAGLSHNMRLIYDGEMPNHKVPEFDSYIEKCMAVSVPLLPEFRGLYTKYKEIKL